MRLKASELFALQAAEHMQYAREMRTHNQQLTRWTKQAQRREVESIPAVVAAARTCNHFAIQWRRRGQ